MPGAAAGSVRLVDDPVSEAAPDPPACPSRPSSHAAEWSTALASRRAHGRRPPRADWTGGAACLAVEGRDRPDTCSRMPLAARWRPSAWCSAAESAGWTATRSGLAALPARSSLPATAPGQARHLEPAPVPEVRRLVLREGQRSLPRRADALLGPTAHPGSAWPADRGVDASRRGCACCPGAARAAVSRREAGRGCPRPRLSGSATGRPRCARSPSARTPRAAARPDRPCA